MPSTIKCPHCRVTLETDLRVGQALRCPGCKENFRIERSMLVSGAEASSNHKLLIPLGYVGFVVVPLVLTVVFVFAFLKKKPSEEHKEETQQVAKSDSRSSTNHEPKKAPKRGPPPRHPQDNEDPETEVATPVKGTPTDTNPVISPKTAVTPKTEISPKPELTPKTEATPKPGTTTPMPAIPEEDTSHTAPGPREVLWKIPVTSYTSDWQKVGDVYVRIGGLAITKAHLIDGKANVVESPSPFLVAIVEVRRGEAKKNQTLLSWTYFRTHYAAIFMKDDKELRPGDLPAGSKLQTKLEKQAIPDDGTSVKDILLFSVPADDAGELNLRLDAERCGEKGDIWFKIPPLAWKKQ